MNAIEVQRLTKLYRLYASPKDRLKEMWSIRGEKYHHEFYALNDISFQVGKGETVGIIGQNGSGKSTLLQIICGVLQPTGGSVLVNGSIAALLELGSGFNPEFTGRENVYLNGALLGFNRKEMDQRFSDIETFAEIGEFISQPVKTYSSGMLVRLAFSVAINVNPDVLIVDEALSVGDAYFQHKCFARIREFQRAGATLLFVSHDPGAVKTLCDRAILLDQGNVIRDGTPDQVLDYYNALIAKREKDLEIFQAETSQGRVVTRSGNHQARIDCVELVNHEGKPTRAFQVGEEARIICQVSFKIDVDSPTLGFLIRDRLGNDVFGTNSFYVNPIKRMVRNGEHLQVIFTLPLNIGLGSYSLTVAIHTHDTHVAENFDWWDQALMFQIVPGPNNHFVGTAYLPVSVQFSEYKTC
jgi:lipopolysaccharide transport system ATP-binding protein